MGSHFEGGKAQTGGGVTVFATAGAQVYISKQYYA